MGFLTGGDKQKDPLVAFQFGLSMEQVASGAEMFFKKVSGLDITMETAENYNVDKSGKPSYQVIPGRMKGSKITLTRAFTDDMALHDAFKNILDGMVGSKRGAGSITGYTQDMKPFVQYTWERGFIFEYKGPSFDSGSSNVLDESVTIAVEKLNRVKV